MGSNPTRSAIRVKDVPSMLQEAKYWVAFHRVPNFGRARFGVLEQRFGSLEDAWNAPGAELRAAGLDARSINTFLTMRSGISPDSEMERLEKLRIQVLTLHDPAYPNRLKEIYDAPPVLYVRGELLSDDEWAVTVVGTRRVTVYGREVTRRLVTDLSKNNVTIISGLARGVDAMAHQAALDAGGRTIAVLACGLDIIYPAAHTALARRIAGQGALLSDYPLGTKPRAEHFPRRNRILAGLTLGTLVVEAPDRSGALITANVAAEEGREVFAVPGSILSPASRGVNRLIQDGAKTVLDFRDVMEELNLQVAVRQLALPEAAAPDEKETTLLDHLSGEPTHIDELRRTVGLPMADVSSALALMELKGLVRQVGAMNYVSLRETPVDYQAGVP
ncbi:MAG: DNA-processing protein DprA [Dehalococcoidia bacterium]